MRVVPSFLPDTGATLTTAIVHRIVDEASVEGLTDGMVFSTVGIVVGSAYTAVLPSLQFIGTEPKAVMHTAASFYPAQLAFGMLASRDMEGYWDKRSGAGNQSIPVGWVVSVPHNDQVFADTPAFTGQRIAESHWVPFISGDPRIVYPHWTSSTGGGRGMLPGDPCFINLQAVTNNGYTRLCTIGFCDALVHYSLSSSFSPGDIYALYHSNNDIGIAQKTRVPISWHGSNTSGVTLAFLPYGLIRQVFTASGVTNIALPQESTAYSLGPQPFYVARIWFWGQPCL